MALFRSIIYGENETRILLIRADSGFGKTKLIDKFWRFCQENEAVTPIKIDFKYLLTDPLNFFDEVLDILGEENFPRYNLEISKLESPQGIEISGNQTVGRLDIQAIQMSLGQERSTRERRLKPCHTAFFDDLRHLGKRLKHRLVFLLDTFEKAENFSAWVEKNLLKEIKNTESWCAVIAGQNVPSDDHIVWGKCADLIELGAIDDENDWLEFSIQAGYN
ncbi:hypothetical protein, partial [Leptolyngbya sp. GGD]|uniref:hypothetical protein n=1 Tax=Leptolyngbya sp. GGD TaxID=2997907 RepID=UPI00227BE513